MLEALGAAVLGYIERELIKHEPEIQEIVVAQLDKLATLLFDYVQQKAVEIVKPPAEEESAPQQLEDIPQ